MAQPPKVKLQSVLTKHLLQISRFHPALPLKVMRLSRMMGIVVGQEQLYHVARSLTAELEHADPCELLEDGDAESAWLLLTSGQLQPAYRFADGGTLLQRAVHSGRLPVLTLLLDAKANVNAKGAYGYTALHEASCIGHGPVVELLLQSGANPDAISLNGSTALLVAARAGHLDVATALLHGKAHPDDGGKRGETPLSIAYAAGHHEVCNVLHSFHGTLGTEDALEGYGEAQREPRDAELAGQLDALQLDALPKDAFSPLEAKKPEGGEVAVMLDSP